MNIFDLARRFQHHPPKDEYVADRQSRVRQACHELASRINDIVGPETREKSLAITHVEEAMMWANAAIARHQEPQQESPGLDPKSVNTPPPLIGDI